MTNIESEKYLERKLTDKVKKLKGKALKFWCLSFTGMPDRMILLPGGQIRFAEIKSTGKQLKPRQKIIIPWLRSLGFIVAVIDTVEKLNEFLNELENDLQTT